jgi:hypothetical protein
MPSGSKKLSRPYRLTSQDFGHVEEDRNHHMDDPEGDALGEDNEETKAMPPTRRIPAR